MRKWTVDFLIGDFVYLWLAIKNKSLWLWLFIERFLVL